MSNDDDIAKELLKGRPENFDETKDWADFQLAVRSASKKEGFLKQMAGLALAITAIVGVVTSVITARQLWLKDAKDEQEAIAKYRFDALKLYTEHWKELSDPINCPRYTVFGTTIRDKAPQLSQAILDDFQRVCLPKIGDAKTTAAVTESTQPSADTAYSTLQQVTPGISSDAKVTTDFSGLTIYVQYRTNKPAATAIRETLHRLGAKAPGIEAVDNVPANDQIRIYKSEQRQLANKLMTELNQPPGRQFTIVDLQKSYPKLPANQMEIWLKD